MKVEKNDIIQIVPENQDFSDTFRQGIIIKQGLTGELTFENEDGKWHEVYENGRIVNIKKLE